MGGYFLSLGAKNLDTTRLIQTLEEQSRSSTMTFSFCDRGVKVEVIDEDPEVRSLTSRILSRREYVKSLETYRNIARSSSPYASPILKIAQQSGVIPDEFAERELFKAVSKGDLITFLNFLPLVKDLEKTNKKQETLLLYASRKGYKKMVQALLDKGANIEARNLSGQNSSMVALKFNHLSLAAELLVYQNIFDRDNFEYTILDYIEKYVPRDCMKGFINSLKNKRSEIIELFKTLKKDLYQKKLWQLLEIPCYLDPEEIQELIKKGASLNLENQEGKLPLQKLIDYKDSFELLVSLGADIELSVFKALQRKDAKAVEWIFNHFSVSVPVIVNYAVYYEDLHAIDALLYGVRERKDLSFLTIFINYMRNNPTKELAGNFFNYTQKSWEDLVEEFFICWNGGSISKERLGVVISCLTYNQKTKVQFSALCEERRAQELIDQLKILHQDYNSLFLSCYTKEDLEEKKAFFLENHLFFDQEAQKNYLSLAFENNDIESARVLFTLLEEDIEHDFLLINSIENYQREIERDHTKAKKWLEWINLFIDYQSGINQRYLSVGPPLKLAIDFNLIAIIRLLLNARASLDEEVVTVKTDGDGEDHIFVGSLLKYGRKYGSNEVQELLISLD